MDGANADSDHSLTWEDFFGSTTDLTPALIGIYDSLLEPSKKQDIAQVKTAKDARNDPPVKIETVFIEEVKHSSKVKLKEDITEEHTKKDPTMIAGSVKLPIATVNKSSLYTLKTNSDKISDSDGKYDLTCSESTIMLKDKQRTFREPKTDMTLGTLSPNVQRMISSASETTTLKFQKKTFNPVRSSTRHKSNIPLVGATSKISQSGVEILPSVEIYEMTKKEDALKPEFKIEDTEATYDVPKNNRPAIYDVPNTNKTAFESLSLPYIDQSIELSITCNDREFDIKLSSKEVSPQKLAPKVPPRKGSGGSPAKFPKVAGTNSLNRNDFKNDSPKKLAKSEPYPEAIGSTGNLKTCAIPEKEVVRLNPPSMEVTRPLSMSSIASSSSTSSSGVQNKGGVNSAYLASIESLDDHSDVDMTSANGSNNFVNSAGVLNKSISEERTLEDIPQQHVDEMSGMSQLDRVCAEIVQTENVYVEDLRQVVEGYLHVWRREDTFSDEELSELFNNIEHIYTFNRSLCEALNSCRLDATCIARCFVDNTSGFSVYTSYCTGYPRTMEVLAALASKPQSARNFRERQIELGHLLPLASYLLKPVQRILKYHLLLQNMVKHCASTETEYALLKMTGIAQHIDDMKRRHEHAVRVQEIQSLLYGWNGPDLTTYGELCAEGTFRVFGAKAMRHAFLFDKMLLVTKNREDGILAYKSHIMCNNMMLVEAIAGAPLSFHVIPWDAPRAQLTLLARSPRHKREWTLLLKRVILENYNAVIPSHARQLVMELGQNKTDDDMLAEKSHNLITQASMRKQLSAPEYLEKRKLDRERRKSFENGIRGRLKKTRKYTLTASRSERNQECDCTQVSAEKGTDYTCDHCYIDLCSDCETELNKDKVDDKCSCRRDDKEITGDKCPECDRALHYIDAGSAEHLERKPGSCKCSDFQSSQESFSKEFGAALNKTRVYHSSDNIINYTESTKSKENLSDTNNSMTSIRNIPKTCLKCAKIKENIVITDSIQPRRSRCNEIERHKTESLRSKSKDDPQRSKLSKIGTWRRKSEPGLQQNTVGILAKKSQDSDNERSEPRGSEKIEFECRNCGSNKITRKVRSSDGTIISDPELDSQRRGVNALKPNLEIRMYNTKNIPKKISKIKKNRAKGIRLGSDTTAKFYADFSTDVSTENILHISESNDSLNVDKPKDIQVPIPETISKDEDIDEETYKKLIEKTDSFKKNELEKVKYLNKQKVINEGSEAEDKSCEVEVKPGEEEVDAREQPLEEIISQLLMQNREFQKLVKKQQLRNSAQRRHQRLMKSHSNPEHVIIAKNLDSKLKSKYGRQSSDNIGYKLEEDKVDTQYQDNISLSSTLEEDHIYETLRVENRVDESLHNLNSKSKVIQHSHVTRPKRLPSPPNPPLVLAETPKGLGPDSDYVYLSFDQLNKIQDTEGIYDVPVKSPQKVEPKADAEYYVPMKNQGPANCSTENDPNIYDSLVEICRRKKDVPIALPTDYLPMNPDQQSPNTPEIWLSRQKEHFNVSRDRKSGSLPRSFQVVTSSTEDNSLTSFKCTPNSNSKTYLNRDGKLKNTDRPYTIASDQSEISYDDVENYMNEGDMLKFNKSPKSETDYAQNISQSTLELEEEIDRCYKNNFESSNNLDKNKNETLLTVSQPNLNTSMTSSCEIIPDRVDEKPADIEVIHPEHKIYKPTSNMLSLKNVLSRFKNRTPNKNEDTEINANDQSSPDSAKSDLKSPTNEKRSGLNPRSYSKNLLQRFRSIIGDEHSDSNENRSQYPTRTQHSIEDTQNNLVKSEIKVVITSTDASPTTSTVVYAVNNELLSKSVIEHSTMTESQNEKNNLETLSISCDNIVRPTYEKRVSLETNVSSSTGSTSKSNNSSLRNLNKMPIYMQGSKHLGARIAQSDYVDPTTLKSEKSALKNVNVLINKNSVRPDSLFSNSSFVTSSSEGTYLECQKTSTSQTETKEKKTESATNNLDDSFYEKSIEKLEQVTDEDVFRDSAVYSDQDDGDDARTDTSSKILNKSATKVGGLKYRSSFKSHVTLTSTTTFQSTQSKITSTANKLNSERSDTVQEKKTETTDKMKSKIAPPVPIKPKINHIPATTFQSKQLTPINRTVEKSSSSESVNSRTIKRNPNPISKPSVLRSESTPPEIKLRADKSKEEVKIRKIDIKTDKEAAETVNKFNSKSQTNIQIKRLSFERASLDSATRRLKSNEIKKPTSETAKVATKSVFERRMEIESLAKSQVAKSSQLKKPNQLEKPKSITTKVASFERSVSDTGSRSGSDKSESGKREVKSTNITPSSSTERANIPSIRHSINQEQDDPKSSWVKQVVNKFQ